MTMVTVAVRNPSAPAVDHPYEASARFDLVMSERRAAEKLGWSVQIEGCEAGTRQGRCGVVVEVRDARGAPVSGLSGHLTARRGDHVRHDRRGPVTEVGPGRYLADLDAVHPGLHDVALRLEGGPHSWVGERRLWLAAGPEDRA